MPHPGSSSEAIRQTAPSPDEVVEVREIGPGKCVFALYSGSMILG